MFIVGDVEHTHLVKGLDFALLHKIRSEIDKEPEDEDPASQRYIFIFECSQYLHFKFLKCLCCVSALAPRSLITRKTI